MLPDAYTSNTSLKDEDKHLDLTSPLPSKTQTSKANEASIPEINFPDE
jgi:hypothetical protein